MKFLSWANNPDDPRVNEFKLSAQRLGIEPVFIGQNYKNFDFTHKQEVLFEAVKSYKDDELVCATDSFDIFFQEPEELIEKKFLEFNCDLVIGVERGYTSQYRKFRQYYESIRDKNSPYVYINAGAVIGYAGAIQKIYQSTLIDNVRLYVGGSEFLKKQLERVSYFYNWRILKRFDSPFSGRFLPWYLTDDQAMLGRYIAKGKGRHNINLDYQTNLFWCTAFEWETIQDHYYIKDGAIVNVHTNQSPSIIHVPYQSKYRDVFEHLFSAVG